LTRIFSLCKSKKKDNIFLGDERTIQTSQFITECCNLGLEFMFNTYFKTGKKLRTDMWKWLDRFKELASYSEGADTILSFIVNREHTSNFIRHYFLECPIVEIREACGQIFGFSLETLIVKNKELPLESLKINSFISSLVQLLDKAVIDLCKNSQEYFRLLYAYADLSKNSAQHLINMSLFSKLLCFLLGSPSAKSDGETLTRRWSNNQTREFAVVHELIALIVTKCNILSLRTCELPEKPLELITDSMTELPSKVSAAKELDFSEHSPQPSSSAQLDLLMHKSSHQQNSPPVFKPPVESEDLIQLPQEMQIYLIGALSNRYLKEVNCLIYQNTKRLLLLKINEQKHIFPTLISLL